MRLVSWNCNGALRRKFRQLDALDADILVVQECENPAILSSEFQYWAGNHAWVGKNKNKGLGVFVRKGQQIDLLDWPDSGLEQFLPVRIDGHIDLIAVWTKQANSPTFSYIGQFWKYLQLYKSQLTTQSIICGDFNSNAIWDKWDRWWNHSDCIKELEETGIVSLYHHISQEEQGLELSPTFYLHRKLSKPYHIDYVFAHTERISASRTAIAIGKPEDWLEFSDHMPVIADL